MSNTMNHVIESIGRWGVHTTPAERRMGKVKPGDIIETPENLRKYPICCRYSRIATIDADGIASVCEGMGSAFLREDGSCDISGGPWFSMPIGLLQPKHELYSATYWNWGDNSPGAGQGIHYNIARPVHILTVHPKDLTQRYGTNEEIARKGAFMHEEPLRHEEWTLYLVGKKDRGNGEFLYVFQRASAAE